MLSDRVSVFQTAISSDIGSTQLTGQNYIKIDIEHERPGA